MIQTTFWEGESEEVEKLSLGNKYPIRYVNKATGDVLKNSTYIKNGKKTRGLLMYFINNEWVQEEDVPERREQRKKAGSSLRGSLIRIKYRMVEKEKVSGKFLIGDNEFSDKWNCYDKLQAHYDEQVERYGPNCPITNQEFTHIAERRQSTKGDGTRRKHSFITTNMSADRILNSIHYTKQNVLFTSIGWNMSRGELSLANMRFFLNRAHVERYEKILRERFPDYKEEAQEQ
tara:strand:+ start:185 stop:880 length:696 start_codon:yes stop_codon:yes gene_type:complete